MIGLAVNLRLTDQIRFIISFIIGIKCKWYVEGNVCKLYSIQRG